MRMEISAKKQKMIDDFKASPLQIGEELSVFEKVISDYPKEGKRIYAEIISIDPLKVKFTDPYYKGKIKTIKPEDIHARLTANIGANPFENTDDKVRSPAYNFESILFNLKIIEPIRKDDYYDINGVPVMELNWNPFIYLPNGEKQYYQRPFVWTLEDKQLLIESIYQRMDIGKVLIRKRDFKELRAMQAKGETELAFNDIVDGKQRLGTIQEFMNDGFQDMHGNYYSDLSNNSQRMFTNNNCLAYMEMECSTDAQVIRQFLKMNHLGVPQSREHIEFVKSLNDSFRKI